MDVHTLSRTNRLERALTAPALLADQHLLAVVSPHETLDRGADHHRGDHLTGDTAGSSRPVFGTQLHAPGRTAIVPPSRLMKFVSPMKSATNGLAGVS
jgi:hypothetical protein